MKEDKRASQKRARKAYCNTRYTRCVGFGDSDKEGKVVW
jgi:hypothetical protein